MILTHTKFAKEYSTTLHHGHNVNIYTGKGDMFSTEDRVSPPYTGNLDSAGTPVATIIWIIQIEIQIYLDHI